MKKIINFPLATCQEKNLSWPSARLTGESVIQLSVVSDRTPDLKIFTPSGVDSFAAGKVARSKILSVCFQFCLPVCVCLAKRVANIFLAKEPFTPIKNISYHNHITNLLMIALGC